MASTNATWQELASTISSSVAAISEYLKTKNVPEPSFAADSPHDTMKDPGLQKYRTALIEAAEDLLHLARGPEQQIREMIINAKYDMMSILALSECDVFKSVPLDKSISITDLAAKAAVPALEVKRLVRHSATQRILTTSGASLDQVSHTATSAYIATAPGIRSMIGYQMDLTPSVVKVPGLLRMDKEAREEPALAPMALTWYPGKEKGYTFFDWAADDEGPGEGQEKGWRYRRWQDGLYVGRSKEMRDVGGLDTRYHWEQLGAGTLVDVGGMDGYASIQVVKSHPHLRCIVQDLAKNEELCKANIEAAGVEGRASFQIHNFYNEQPVKNASAYMIKHVLHDWSDTYARKIIRNVADAMGPESRLLIVESGSSFDPAGTKVQKRTSTNMDLAMLLLLNGQQRDADEWKELAEGMNCSLKLTAIVQLANRAGDVFEFRRDSV